MDSTPLAEEANNALIRARELAAAAGLDRASPPHILMALLENPTIIRLLELFHLDPERARAGLEFLGSEELRLDSDAEERTANLARLEAKRLGHPTAGAEHLLVGLLRQTGSLTVGILESMGLSRDSVREAIRFLHGEVADFETAAEEWSKHAGGYDVFESAEHSAPGRLERMTRDAEQFQTIYESSLHRVIAVGQSVVASEVRVELIALQIRSEGGIFIWQTHATEDRLLGPPQLTVSDDLGTDYAVHPGVWSAYGHVGHGESLISPRPPDRARQLTVNVRLFGRGESWSTVFAASGATVAARAGQWRFAVVLREDSGFD